MTLQDLQQRCAEIDAVVNQTVTSDIEETYPITDGIIDPERYYAAKYKILWILKEPVDEIDDDGTPYGGGWSLMDGLRKNNAIEDYTGGLKTFKPMMYVAYGILNGFCLYNDMDDIEDDPSMLNSFKSTGYINVKKLPGRTKAHNATIAAAYQQHKGILHRQLLDYNPDIVIGGSTLQYFFNDLGIDRAAMHRDGSVHFAFHDGKIFIAAYHPAQWNVHPEPYVDDIVRAAKQWATTKERDSGSSPE